MKILALTGSPRKNGNTEKLVKSITAGAASNGAVVSVHDLGKMDISGCRACMHCKTHENCAIKDDASPVLRELLTADALILGSPVYMWQMSAQTKLFVDRIFSMLNRDFSVKFKPGLPVVLAYTQGQADTSLFKGYFDATANMLNFIKFNVIDTIVAGGCNSRNDIEKNEALLTKAETIGANLAKL